MYVNAIRVMLLGGLAGGVSKFIVYPLDTVKKRLQAQVWCLCVCMCIVEMYVCMYVCMCVVIMGGWQ